MVGIHVDDIIVSGERDVYDAFFDELKEIIPVKIQGGCIQ